MKARDQPELATGTRSSGARPTRPARKHFGRAKNHTNRLVKGLFSTTSRRPAAKYRVMEADTSCWTTYL
ncbi:hypothetical protein PF005_g6590 [Phytophthora fragariae]|nr:hypothetical protein PF011_g15375 [Phytophthora fragariae]KAE9212810.1 hypothetical protein PF004_g15529 [Phytophthora fragariae]KAE9222731.1 hypothetical protein PF005_g6590 [Phytophthora fragariae]KAE9244793.1 hypothetical protein PF002_g7585 [Phytophthora fragariae]